MQTGFLTILLHDDFEAQKLRFMQSAKSGVILHDKFSAKIGPSCKPEKWITLCMTKVDEAAAPARREGKLWLKPRPAEKANSGSSRGRHRKKIPGCSLKGLLYMKSSHFFHCFSISSW